MARTLLSPLFFAASERSRSDIPETQFRVKTPDSIARICTVACLPLAFASCRVDDFACNARRNAPAIQPMTAEYRCLKTRVNRLNHEMVPLEDKFDKCAYPKRLLKQIAHLDEDVQHVNAEMVLREVPPERVECQLARIDQRLFRIETEISALQPVPGYSKDGCYSCAMRRWSLSWR